jgi:predicted enzyme related to lactoylglutathione lyase
VSERSSYPPGVPCWVDTLQPDVRAALEFYRAVFGWEPAGPGAMPDGGGAYFVARAGGRDVAGIGALPAGVEMRAAWTTYVRVDDAGESAQRATAAGGRMLAAPFDVPPAGRMAVVADAEGAAFGLWEPRERAGAQLVNEPNAWSMSMLHARDLQRAAAFYRALFGWEAEPLGDGDMLLRLPGYVGGEPQQPVPRDVVAVMTRLGDNGPAAGPFWSVDFRVDDADAAAERAAKHGGRVIVPVFEDAMFKHAVLADRAGAPFSVSQLIRSKPN